MAILIKKRRTRILSRYDKPFKYGGETIYGGQSSRITNIASIERDRNSVKTVGFSGRKNPTPEEVYSYDIFFRVDMRQAIDLDISSLDFSLLASPLRTKLGNFSPESTRTGSPRKVISALFKGNKEAARLAKVDKSNKVIGAGRVDLNPYINQSNISDMSASDEAIFGRVKALTLKKIDKKTSEKNEKSQAFQPQNFNDKKTNVQKDIELNFFNEYTRMIEMGIDPASIFFPDPEYSISKSGEARKTQPAYPSKIRPERVNAIRKSFALDSISSPPNNSVKVENTIVEGKVVSYETFVADRYKVVKVSFDIREKTLRGLSSFLFQVHVKDSSSGIILEKLEINIPHSQHVENYYIPDYLPEILAFKNTKGVGDTSVDISFSNLQVQKVKDIQAKIRKINDDSPLGHSPYSEKFTILSYADREGVKNQPSYRVRKAYKISPSQMIIARPTILTSRNVSISNIQNSGVEVGDYFNYLYSGIDVDSVKEGFLINYYVNSESASGVVLYRKMSGEIKFTPINHTLESSIGREENTVPFRTGDNISQACGDPGGGTFKDRIGDSPNREKVFHYKKKIFLKSGGYVWDKKTITAMRRKSLGVTDVNVENILQPLKDNVDHVSFDMSAIFSSTNTDLLLEMLRDDGKDGIFRDVIQSVRSSLSDILVFGVTRTNLTTSEVEFLGYYKEGSFTDDGSFTGTAASIGSKYKYKISTYLVNPELVQKYFSLSVNYNRNVLSKTYQVRMPSYIQKIQNVAIRDNSSTVGTNAVDTASVSSFENLKIQKYYSGKEMEVGKIRSNQDYSQDYNFERFSTGDYTNIYVNLTGANVSIEADAQSSVSRSYSGCPVIRFSVKGDTDSLDFLVITCHRNGVEKIVGTCMPTSTGDVVFVDYTSSNFVGQVEYYAKPVFLDGRLGIQSLVGNSILLQFQPSIISNTSSARGY
jgi:hypothetical protein